jgi:hypothetical protein
MDLKNNRAFSEKNNAYFLGEKLNGCILPIAVAE